MTLTSAQIWLIIAILAVGTFLIRFSFLGLIGDRPLPPFVLRLLRFTPVAVIPAMVAPLVLWPEATGGHPEPVRLLTAAVTLAVGIWRRNTLWAMAAGAVVFYAGLALTGQP